MSSLRNLRRKARSLLLLAAVLMTQALLLVAPVTASAASGAQVTVELSSLNPAVAVKGGTLRLAGSLVGGSTAHGDVTVRLAVAQMQVRSDLTTDAGIGSRLIYGHDHTVGSLAAGATVPWSLSVPVSALYLTSQAVYALDIEAYAGDLRIGALRTYLPYAMATSDSSFHPTQMVVLLPITAAPALDGQVDKDVPEAASDDLSAQFALGGRLNQTLGLPAANPQVTISWAVDPDLLTTADSESLGYSLYPDSHSGAGAQNAADWLAQAKSALSANGELWQLPATDPDLGSLGHATASVATDLVKSATARSLGILEHYLDRAPQGTLAWPAQGQADPGTLALAAATDPAAIVVRSDSVALHTPMDSYTPTGRAQLDGKAAVVSDAALDDIFAGDTADAGWKGSDLSLLAAQRLLADSALIALERPNLANPRTIMVTAPRGVRLDPALLTAIGEASWIKTVGLSTLLAAHPDSHTQTSPPKRDPVVAKADLNNAQLAATSALSASLRALTEIVIDPKQTTGSYDPAVLRTVSTAWRSTPSQQAAFSAAVRNRLQTRMNLVTLVKKSDLTLSGKSGVIPFTVENRLERPVRVGIRITTNHPGLSVQSITVQEVPQGSTTINVHVSSAVSGTRVTVTAQLVTPGGTDFGQPESLQVTVSSIGSITLVIFALSAALLVIAVGLRIYRGRRARGPQAVPESSGASVDNGALAEAEREQ